MGTNIKKILVVIFVIFANVALSVTPDCSEITETYELTLNNDDEDVLKLARDGWNLLVSSGKNRGALKFINLGIEKAKVQVVGSERRYTILLQYDVGNSLNFYLNCYLFVWTDHTNINFIDCWPGFFYEQKIQSYRAQYEMYYYLHRIFGGLGQSCSRNEDCLLKNSECRGSTCKCLANFIKLDGKCMPLIGGTCEKEDDCRIVNTNCDGVCKCREGLGPAEDNTYCRDNTIRIGSSCKGDDCNSIRNAVCKEAKRRSLLSSLKEKENTRFKCQCKPDHYQLGKECAKFAKGLKDKCEDRVGCARIPGSRCDKVSMTCQCLEKYFYQVEDTCFKKAKGLGNECKTDEGCTKIDNAECLDNTCQCKEEFYNWEGVCYKYADNLGEICYNDGCKKLNGSECVEGMCKCKVGWYSFGNKCFEKPTAIGAECKSDDGCEQISGSRCDNGVCNCKTGFYLAENSGICLPLPKDLNKNCVDTQDCKTLFSECSNGTCDCRADYVVHNGVCYGLPGAQCYGDKDCASVSYYCDSGTCQKAASVNVTCYWGTLGLNRVNLNDSLFIGKTEESEQMYVLCHQDSNELILKGPLEWKSSNFTLDTAIVHSDPGNGKVTLKCRAQHKGSLQFERLEFPSYNKCNFDHDEEVFRYDSFEVLVDNSL